jgi:hypothetical protein
MQPGGAQHQQAGLVDLDARLARSSPARWRLSAECRPKVLRSSARSHISSSASSHWPMVRMQWCTRPGPSRACASAKPSPGAEQVDAGTRTSRNTSSQCPSGLVLHDRDVAHDLQPGRVHRHEHQAVAAVRGAHRARRRTRP